MELLKLLSSNEIAAQIVNFLLLLFLLRIFFWKRILKLLDERKTKITSEFENIENIKKEVEELKSDYETKLNSIEEITKAKIREAIDEGKKIIEQMKKEAYLDAQKIIESAERDIKYEVAQAREELKEEIVNLTIKVTESVIGEKLTEADDKKLVENFLKQFDKIK